MRVYTTLTKGAEVLRECDSDAMRVVVGCLDDSGKFWPLGKSRKILRTAPRDAADRPQACLDRLVQAIRDGYGDIKKVPTCPKCGTPMAIRKPKKNGKQFSPFFSCVRWPSCNGTKNA